MFELALGTSVSEIQAASGTHIGIQIAKLCVNSLTVSEVLLSSSPFTDASVQVLSNMPKESV
jgi:hypothetical protein